MAYSGAPHPEFLIFVTRTVSILVLATESFSMGDVQISEVL